MRICLTGPPTLEHVTHATLAENESARAIADRIPLGVLAVAAALEKEAIACTVLDLNRAFLDHMHASAKRNDFVSFAVEYLDGFDFDLLGLGSMCSSYPATLQIAAAVKARRPGTLVVLGGPQASVVDIATLERFSCVDFIVRGEADHSLVRFLQTVEKGDDIAAVEGITFRKKAAAHRTPTTPLIQPLDALPLPAFHLLANMGEIRTLPLELGRGCPFSCTFCSTNDFFRRRFRLKKPESVIAEMRILNVRYGVKDFNLVHDMFTVDRKRVVEFCEAMKNSGTGFEWSCSARTDSVDHELISLMADAGCRGLFFGIETGSQKMQKIIDKELDVEQAFAMVAASNACGISTAVSTIIGFPEEEIRDLEATMNFVMDAARFEYIEPQVGILAPLAGTPIFYQYRDRLSFDPLLADFSYTSLFENYNQFEMIKADPEIFSNFFALPAKIPRNYLFELKLFFHSAFHQCRWLLVAAHQGLGGIMSVFEQWLAYRRAPGDLVQYYITQAFKRDFINFLNSIEVDKSHEITTLGILIAAYKATLGPMSLPAAKIKDQPLSNNYPVLCDGAAIQILPGSVEEAIAALQQSMTMKAGLPIKHLMRWNGEIAELLPLHDSVAAILALCDGNHSAEEIIRLATGARLDAPSASQLFSQLSQAGVVTSGSPALATGLSS